MAVIRKLKIKTADPNIFETKDLGAKAENILFDDNKNLKEKNETLESNVNTNANNLTELDNRLSNSVSNLYNITNAIQTTTISTGSVEQNAGGNYVFLTGTTNESVFGILEYTLENEYIDTIIFSSFDKTYISYKAIPDDDNNMRYFEIKLRFFRTSTTEQARYEAILEVQEIKKIEEGGEEESQTTETSPTISQNLLIVFQQKVS